MVRRSKQQTCGDEPTQAENAKQGYQIYRMDVTQNAGSSYWCIEELSFYDASGNRLSTVPSGGSAQTEYASAYAAGKAFNEVSNADESYYCSHSGTSTGWLQYTFSTNVTVASYKVERLNGHGNQYSPVAWTLTASKDGGSSWSTLDQQSGHSSWTDGEKKTFTISAVVHVGAAYQIYRMDVTQNAGSSYWCIEELSFYDASGNRLSTVPSGGSAQTEYASAYAAGKAFNEVSNADESYYCSHSGTSTGWLQYTFSTNVTVASYKVERLNGHGNQYSPVAWTLTASKDGGSSWSTLDLQSGHSSWTDGEKKTFTISEALTTTAPMRDTYHAHFHCLFQNVYP